MPTPRLQPVYASVNRPLTVGGADRRLFFVALVVGGATFTLFGSFFGGVLMLLDEPVRGRSHSVAAMLHGLVTHHLYHAGQIALLKRAAGVEPLAPADRTAGGAS
jgi:hypothetical protein